MHQRELSQISIPPSPAPQPATLPVSAAPAPQPATLSTSAAPASQPATLSASAAVFSVLSYGAVGDGLTDDTQAFKMAWDAACQIESAIFLVPKHYSFMIQSTIFTGPCKNGLIFQVTFDILVKSEVSFKMIILNKH
ncbi:polygalacturonase-like [Forsythia ovata]|uniref:Polygalacturonase-like n=1 Tax=Forsythia ovata TaxID=205694 RepID=A0ABD1TMI3_9LAMI